MSKTVSVRVSEEIHQKLLDKCNEKGTTMNDKLKEMIGEELNKTTSENNSNEEDSGKEPSEIEKLLGLEKKEKNHFSEITETKNKINSLHNTIHNIKTEVKQQDNLIKRLVNLNHLKTTPCVSLRCITNKPNPTVLV